MTDAELRALVRDAVARHLGPPAQGPATAGAPQQPAQAAAAAPGHVARAVASHAPLAPSLDCSSHPSHRLYVSLVNVDTACVIEPSVACDHCGYCRSHGH